MRVLNLYCGVGGNRKHWSGVAVTAVEQDPRIAAVYQRLNPDDEVIVGDAHAPGEASDGFAPREDEHRGDDLELVPRGKLAVLARLDHRPIHALAELAQDLTPGLGRESTPGFFPASMVAFDHDRPGRALDHREEFMVAEFGRPSFRAVGSHVVIPTRREWDRDGGFPLR